MFPAGIHQRFILMPGLIAPVCDPARFNKDMLMLAWVEGRGTKLSHEEIARYSRHLLLPEVGVQGQERLKGSSVLLVGTGGLGSPVAMYLAAAGIGRLGLVDYDIVEFSNLQRQIVHGTSTIGDRKVLSALARLRDLNPDVEIEVHDVPFTADNALHIADPYDLIIDATDNFPTRYLTNDVCVLQGKPNIYGSIFRFEGQASVFWADHGPCYRCIFPDPPPAGLIPSCADSGVFGVLPGTIGTIQATEALKLLLGIGEPLLGRLLLYNALDLSFETIQLKKNPNCRICSPDPEITSLVDYEAFCGSPGYNRDESLLSSGLEIEPEELALRLKRKDPLRLIDVREPHEQGISHIEPAELIPLGEFAARMDELDPSEEIALLCRNGIRSARALQMLAAAGFQKAYNVRGGINAWAERIDPSLPRY